MSLLGSAGSERSSSSFEGVTRIMGEIKLPDKAHHRRSGDPSTIQKYHCVRHRVAIPIENAQNSAELQIFNDILIIYRIDWIN